MTQPFLINDPLLQMQLAKALASQSQMAMIGQNMSNALGDPNGLNWQAAQALPSNPAYPPGSSNHGAASLALANSIAAASALNPEPLQDAGLRAGEVTAWRCWRINKGFLRSCFVESIWAPGEPMTGTPNSHFGIHAWKTLAKTLDYGLHDVAGGGPFVIGQIELWGDIIEHEHGYRAEFAAIKSLDMVFGAERDLLVGLRTLYSVGGRDDLVPPKMPETPAPPRMAAAGPVVFYSDPPAPPAPSMQDGFSQAALAIGFVFVGIFFTLILIGIFGP